MKVYEYDAKAGYQRRICEVCSKVRNCCQHHFEEGRHSNKIIWVCDNLPDKILYKDPCHRKIHEPTSFGLPANWSYDNGYMSRTTSKIRKKASSKNKWEVKKKHSSSEKWKIKKKIGNIDKWKVDLSKKYK